MSEVVKDGIIFKTCPDFPAYAASQCGKIIRLDTMRYMSQFEGGVPSYLLVRTSIKNKVKSVRVHRLVASAWLVNDDPENKIQVNHVDGNKFNNHIDNLEWVTRSQNQRHAVETGLKGKGSDLYNSTLTDNQVHTICKLLIDGIRAKELSELFSVSIDIIRKIKAGETYFHVRTLYEIPHTFKKDFSYETVVWVCENIVKGFGDKEIVKLSSNQDLTVVEIKRIRYKIRYKTISDEFF